jgi:hypothetical protein
MKKIGGNIFMQLQEIVSTKSNIGEDIEAYENYLEPIKGWLDMNSGDTKYTTYNSAITESTHVFLSDYQLIEKAAKNLSAVINGKRYDVTYIDNPQERNYHLEIFLRAVE